MAESKIEWTGKTWNPTTGCTQISSECDNCYAKVMTNRYMHNSNQPKYKAGFDVVVEHPDSLDEPRNWPKPTTIFVNSMSDLFHRDISLDFLKRVFKVMNETPQHTYQVLTKRHKLLERHSKELNWTDNIWMGVSVGTQKATERITSLQMCGAKHKFLSVEPLIEKITEMDLTGIDLVLVGGESGDNNSRPMPKEWVLEVKKFCKQYNVPFFFKQWGLERNNPNENDPTMNKDHRYYAKGGCMLDGKVYLSNPSIKNDSTPTLKLFGKDYYIMDDKFGLNTIWELKSYLPMMEKELFAQLCNDIQTNGVNDPVLYWVTPEGKPLVIEGHTRLTAAIRNRLKEIPRKEITEQFNSLDEIKLWMIKHQFQRRNLSTAEKIQLAYLSKETIERTAKENLSKGGKNINVTEHVDTNDEIARIAGVGRTTVVRYAAVVEKASPSVLHRLKKGEITISAAHQTIKDSHETPIKKREQTEPEDKPAVKIFPSIEKGTKLLRSGGIDALMIVKDQDQIERLGSSQKKKLGFYLLKESD